MLLKPDDKSVLNHISSIGHDGKVVLVGTSGNGTLYYTVKQTGFEDSCRDQSADVPIGWEKWELLPLPGAYLRGDNTWVSEKADTSVLEREAQLYSYPKGTGPSLIGSVYDTRTMSAVYPVQLVSGLGHLFVFRQSRQGTLLVDRFVLDGMTNKLVRKLEVRFKRSSERYTPLQQTDGSGGLGTIDSLDFKDENGHPFFEPTTELTHIKDIGAGLFSVVLVPTDDHDISRWHIFAWNSNINKVESYSIRATKDRVFDITDQFVTHPKTGTISGIIRHTLTFNPDTGEAPNGLAASHYDVQAERETRSGPKLLREESRVMLAIATPAGMITVSFGSASDGTMGRIKKTRTSANIDPFSGAAKLLREDTRDVFLPVDTLDKVDPISNLHKPVEGTLLEASRSDNDLVVLLCNDLVEDGALKPGDIVNITDTLSRDGKYTVMSAAESFIQVPKDEDTRSVLGKWKKIPKDPSIGQFSDGMISAVSEDADALGFLAAGNGVKPGNEVQILGTHDLNGLHEVHSVEFNQITLRRRWTSGKALDVEAILDKQRGMQFNNAEAYMETPVLGLDDPSQIANASMTVSLWVRIPAADVSNRTLIAQQDGSFALSLQKGRIVVRLLLEDGPVEISDPQEAEGDRWVHYAVTVTSTSDFGYPKTTAVDLYRQGVLVSSSGAQGGLPVVSDDWEEDDPASQTNSAVPVAIEPRHAVTEEALDVWCARSASSLSVQGDWAIVGMQSAGEIIQNNSPHSSGHHPEPGHRGAVLFFKKNANGYVFHQKIDGPRENFSHPMESGFGHSVAIHGTRAVVAGASYALTRLYELVGDEWIFVNHFPRNGDQILPPGMPNSVAIHEKTIVIGSPKVRRGRGFEYVSEDGPCVFVLDADDAKSRHGSGWHPSSRIAPHWANARLDFGAAVAIEGDTILVSSTNASHGGDVTVFTRRSDRQIDQDISERFKSGTRRAVWQESYYHHPSNPHRNNGYGAAVAIEGNLVCVSCLGADRSGVVFTYELKDGTLTWRKTIEPKEARQAAAFGAFLAINDELVMIGAPGRYLREPDRQSRIDKPVDAAFEVHAIIEGAPRRTLICETGNWGEESDVSFSDLVVDASYLSLLSKAADIDSLSVDAPVDNVEAPAINVIARRRKPRKPAFYIGGAPADFAAQDGSIEVAEVRAWNCTRTAEQINSMMHLTLLGHEIDLAGYWRMGGIVPGEKSLVTDFSTAGHNGEIHGDAFVSAATLNRHLKSPPDREGPLANAYENDHMIAVTQNAKYVERFEFRLDTGNVPANDLFAFAYRGKRNHSASDTVPANPNDPDPFKSVRLNFTEVDGQSDVDIPERWYVAECNFSVPEGVSLLRSFGLSDVSEDATWSKLFVRNHSITLTSNTITEDHHEDEISLITHGDDAQATASLKTMERLELESARLRKRAQLLQMKLYDADVLAKKIAMARSAVDVQAAEPDGPVAKAVALLAEEKTELGYAKQKITLFYDDGFGPSSSGKCWHEGPGRRSLAGTGWDGITSSIKVPHGLRVMLYDKDFNSNFYAWGLSHPGKEVTLEKSESSLHRHGFNDDLTAFVVETINKKYQSLSQAEKAKAEAEAGLKVENAKLKSLTKTRDDLISLQKGNIDDERAELTGIFDRLEEIDVLLPPENALVLAGIRSSWVTPLVMDPVSDDRGLKTFSARLGAARSNSPLTVLNTCEGNVQFTFVDDDKRTRHWVYDPVADSHNGISEQWIPEGLRSCVELTAPVRLNTPIPVSDQYSAELWISLPLGRVTKGAWNADTSIANVVYSSKGKTCPVSIKSDPGVTAEYLGVFCEGAGGDGFKSCGFDLNLLDAGWHHLAVVRHGDQSNFFVDGTPVGNLTHDPADKVEQLELSHLNDGGALNVGKVAELRVWDRMLPDEEIMANMESVLSGNEPDLLAYLAMDDAAGRKMRDKTGNSHSAVIDESFWRGCSAPIGQHKTFTSSVSCYEVSQIERRGGEKVSIMRRGLAYPTDEGIEIVPDRPIEQLELVWVGNCQFEPTLLGYVEGTPPVPSENLTVKSDYSGASSVTLTHSSDVSYTWSGSNNVGTAEDGKFFLGTQATESAGVTLLSKIEEHEQGAIGHLKTGYMKDSNSAITSNSSEKASDGLSLRGAQEKTAAFEDLGKRFVPKNTGYALVVSGLADVFISRLSRSGRMVAYSTVPVKDIPPDINTITFLMNPAYTLAGSLDGQVGTKAASERFYPEVPDMRAQFGSKYPASYYRLDEATDLKVQIDRQDKEREAYFTNFQSQTVDFDSLKSQISGGNKIGDISVNRAVDQKAVAPKPGAKDTAKADQDKIDEIKKKASANLDHASKGAREKQAQIAAQLKANKKRVNASAGFERWQKSMEDIQERSGKRNIVNNYVWDADGGTHIEAQSFANSIQHTVGGSTNLNIGGGAMGKFFGAGHAVKLEGTAGLVLKQTLSKTKKTTEGFGLNCSVAGVEHRGITDPDDYPLQPGEKVGRYRFMSFYLDGNTKNFADFFGYVVDPEWLQSNSEEARALRSANGKPNQTWRILHRVTYVERPALMGFGRDMRPLEPQGGSSVEAKLADLAADLEKLQALLKDRS